MEYNEKEPGKKNEVLIAYMQSKGYFVYADTYINTIFVDVERFKNHFVEFRKAREIQHGQSQSRSADLQEKRR